MIQIAFLFQSGDWDVKCKGVLEQVQTSWLFISGRDSEKIEVVACVA